MSYDTLQVLIVCRKCHGTDMASAKWARGRRWTCQVCKLLERVVDDLREPPLNELDDEEKAEILRIICGQGPEKLDKQ